MLFRINHQNFLTHMIDYFMPDELYNLNYAIVSSRIKSGGTSPNVKRLNDVFPSVDVALSLYKNMLDDTPFEKTYMRELRESENIIYHTIINPILKHQHNFCLVCHHTEDRIVDVLCKYLKKEFNLRTVDLNKLFKDGETDVFYIDRKDLHNSTVRLKRDAKKDAYDSYSSSKDGQKYLIKKMSKKEKLKKLKELKVDVISTDMDYLDELLEIAWEAELE